MNGPGGSLAAVVLAAAGLLLAICHGQLARWAAHWPAGPSRPAPVLPGPGRRPGRHTPGFGPAAEPWQAMASRFTVNLAATPRRPAAPARRGPANLPACGCGKTRYPSYGRAVQVAVHRSGKAGLPLAIYACPRQATGWHLTSRPARGNLPRSVAGTQPTEGPA